MEEPQNDAVPNPAMAQPAQEPPPAYQPSAYPQQQQPQPYGQQSHVQSPQPYVQLQQLQQGNVAQPPQQYGQQQDVHQVVTISQTQQLVPISNLVAYAGSNCPICQIGTIYEIISPSALLWAILCFPCGLLACFLMKERKCSHCGVCFD